MSALISNDVLDSMDTAFSSGAERRIEVIDRDLKVPVYEQVYSTLKRRILDGYYSENEFPSSRTACAEFGVSRISVKSALVRLHQEGLISMSRGRDTLVVADRAKSKISANLGTLLADLERLELATNVVVLAHKKCPAGSEVANLLSCDSEDLIQQSTRLRTVDGSPFSIVKICVPETIMKKVPVSRFDRPISADLMSSYGIYLHDVKERISACMADREIAEGLDIAFGAPVLKITRAYLSRDAEPVICTLGHYRSDRYEHQTSTGVSADWQVV